MANTKFSTSSINQGLVKSRSMLVANAPYIPTSFQSIASATGTGSSNTITFSSIPQDFASLHVRCTIKDAFTTSYTIVNSPTLMRLNSIDTASYRTHKILSGAGADLVNPVGEPLANHIYLYGPTMMSSSGLTNFTGSLIIDIYDYASSTKKTTVRYIAGNDNNTGGSTTRSIVIASALLNNTSAVNSITFFSPGNFFTNETSISLYGIKGA